VRERVQLILGAFGMLFQRKALAARLTLEQKLAILAGCGLRLKAPFTIDDLLKSWTREDFEKDGFDAVLVGLGMTEEEPPWRDHCVNAWHLDTECIENSGDYCRIAERMKAMAQGSLPIENIRDHIDVEGRVAWLTFDYRGRNTRIDCKVEDDWVDAEVFRQFVDLLAQSDQSKIYLSYDLGGQDLIIACVTKSEFAELKRNGVRFEALR
jgi:hypothetical protein